MSTPLDITAFRKALNHDAEAEKMLLGLYIRTTDEALAAIHTAQPTAEWVGHMHLIKGAALNVGAQGMAAIAAEGERLGTADREAKAALLARLEAEYAHVRAYLLPLIE